jgi:membrane fusion protein
MTAAKKGMGQQLFRREALARRQERMFGDVVLVRPVSTGVFSAGSALVALCILTFLFLGHYTRRREVSGYLVPDKGVSEVIPPRPGVVARRMVEEGQHVRRNDPLFSISTARSSDGVADVDAAVIRHLDRRLDDLRDQYQSREKLARLEVRRDRDKVNGLKSQLQRLAEQLATDHQRLVTSSRRLNRYEALRDSGSISGARLDQARDDYLRLQAAEQDLKSRQAALRAELDAARSALPADRLRARTRLSQIDDNIEEITQQLLRLGARREYVLRAPVAGTATAVTVHPGERVGDQPLVSLVPDDAQMRARLYVPASAIGFIHPGEQVRLRYSAFPHERFGSYRGTVRAVSRTILTPREIHAPLKLSRPVYPVDVQLRRQSVMAYGRRLPLRPGISLKADILLDRRSLWDWILDPLYSALGETHG